MTNQEILEKVLTEEEYKWHLEFIQFCQIKGIATFSFETVINRLAGEVWANREAIKGLNAGKPIGPIVGATKLIEQDNRIHELETTIGIQTERIAELMGVIERLKGGE